MNVSDVVLEMEIGGVDSADIAEIVELCKGKSIDVDFIDEELLKRGYSAIFNVDEDEYDGWEEEYNSVEKFPHKKHYTD